MRGASVGFGALLICAITTVVSWGFRFDLPADDGTELVRQINLWQGFAAMSAIDALTIMLLRWHGKCYKRLTNPLTIILSCSIINHAYGAFAYAARNFQALSIYDGIVMVIALAQIAVFFWWWGSRHGRRDRRYHPRVAGSGVYDRAVTLCNIEHEAGHK